MHMKKRRLMELNLMVGKAKVNLKGQQFVEWVKAYREMAGKANEIASTLSQMIESGGVVMNERGIDTTKTPQEATKAYLEAENILLNEEEQVKFPFKQEILAEIAANNEWSTRDASDFMECGE